MAFEAVRVQPWGLPGIALYSAGMETEPLVHDAARVRTKPPAARHAPASALGIGVLALGTLGLFVASLLPGPAARAADAPISAKVQFPSLDDGLKLDGYLARPADGVRHPALVFLHGCGGLLHQGRPEARVTAWSELLVARGYAVLMVDSFTPRDVRLMCGPRNFNVAVLRARPADAYGALLWLQAQSFVRPDRVGVMGWSEGGGTILLAIGAHSLGRPDSLPHGDFRVAVAFYPGWCADGKLEPLLQAHARWTTPIPFLMLVGSSDVWTPAEPCRAMLEHAQSLGSAIEMHIYPGAYHDFDWPDQPIRRLPQFTSSAGVVPITGTDPAARADALERVPAFLAKYLDN